MEQKKSLITKLTNKYLLIIRNEDNFAEKSTFSFTYAKVGFFLLFAVSVIFCISMYLATTILAKWFDPRHAEIEANKKLFELTIQIDSLERAVDQKNTFINSLKVVMSDSDEEVANIALASQDTKTDVKEARLTAEELKKIDEEFKNQFENEESEPAPLSTGNEGALQEMFFFKPIVGPITDTYDVKTKHYGVDIVSKVNEPVKCVADGTVILSSWTQDSGYIVAVQHRGNLISMYKHNSELLKNVGEFVKAGEVISIIGNTGELTTGPHLHFELWYNGNPANPQDYIAF